MKFKIEYTVDINNGILNAVNEFVHAIYYMKFQ